MDMEQEFILHWFAFVSDYDWDHSSDLMHF